MTTTRRRFLAWLGLAPIAVAAAPAMRAGTAVGIATFPHPSLGWPVLNRIPPYPRPSVLVTAAAEDWQPSMIDIYGWDESFMKLDRRRRVSRFLFPPSRRRPIAIAGCAPLPPTFEAPL